MKTTEHCYATRCTLCVATILVTLLMIVIANSNDIHINKSMENQKNRYEVQEVPNIAMTKEIDVCIIENVLKMDGIRASKSVDKSLFTEYPQIEILTYTESDLELLARLMYAEEGVLLQKLPEWEAQAAHKLCGSVVLNRLNCNFGGATTIEEVIYAPGQYSSASVLFEKEVPDIVYQWAEELLMYGPIGPENMVFQSQSPQGSETYKQIYNQYFCLQ